MREGDGQIVEGGCIVGDGNLTTRPTLTGVECERSHRLSDAVDPSLVACSQRSSTCSVAADMVANAGTVCWSPELRQAATQSVEVCWSAELHQAATDGGRDGGGADGGWLLHDTPASSTCESLGTTLHSLNAHSSRRGSVPVHATWTEPVQATESMAKKDELSSAWTTVELQAADADASATAPRRARAKPTKVLHSRNAKRIPGAMSHFARRSLEKSLLHRCSRRSARSRRGSVMARRSVESQSGAGGKSSRRSVESVRKSGRGR